MSYFLNNKNQNNITGLLNELKRLADAGEAGDFSVLLDSERFSGDEAEIISFINKAGDNFRASLEYDLMKYKLANNALNIALWDMDVVSGDPVNPDNKFTWSHEFRRMLGFTNESDFPNMLHSWSSRLHPEDKEKTLGIFAAHINDRTGNTPYDIEYRLMLKNGNYQYFHAFGATLRDSGGVPLRVAGAIMDITEKKQMEEKLQKTLYESIKIRDIMTSVLNKSDAMIYVTDLETDEILFISDYMKRQFGIKDDVIGQPCYKVLQLGMDKRCDFCPCHQLDKEPDKAVIWEERNTVTNRHYINTDRYVDWPGGKKVHIQYCIDLTDLKQRETMLNALNKTATMLISQRSGAFGETMSSGIWQIADLFEIDRFSLFRNFTSPDGQLHASQIYRWDREAGGTTPPTDFYNNLPYAKFAPNWEFILSNDIVINGPVSLITDQEAATLKTAGVVSVFVTPIFIDSVFWGFAFLEDRNKERYFNDNCADIMRSAAFLYANAVIRNELEHEIVAANERTALMLDSNPMCCQLFDAITFNKIDCNQEAIRLFGFKDKAEFFERYQELYPQYQPDGQNSIEKVRNYLIQTLAEGRCSFDWTYMMLDGTLMPAEVTLIRLKRGEDYIIASYARDLREHRKMIQDIEYKDSLLHAVNSAAGFLLNSNTKTFESNLYKSMGIIAEAVNVDRMYVWKNNMFEGQLYCAQIYEWSEGAKPQQGKDFTKGMPYSGNIARWEVWLSSGKCINNVVCDMPAKERELLNPQDIISILVVPVEINGSFWGFVGLDDCRNERLFTETEESVLRSGSLLIANAFIRNEMEQETITALLETQVANRAKSEFLARMSHDMRTPLNAVIGMSELSLEGDGISEEDRLNIEKIHNAGTTLLNLVNDILDISKIEAGKLELVTASYDVPSLINDTVTQNILRINGKPITFKLNIDEDMYSNLHGDELRIKQIMNNLLSNAIKFTKEGIVELSVHCAKDNEIVWLTIQVRDTGRGIRSGDINKLFFEYSQFDLKSNHTIEGTGLGLSITKKLTELMGGSINVESEYGKGSIFTVKIAQEYLSEARIGPEVVDNLQKFSYSDKKRDKNIRVSRIKLPYARVLVVDDNLTNLDIAKGLLNLYEMQIDCVTSGQEAIDAILEAEVRYNAVFMDYMMPEIDGIEATRIIREIDTEYANNIPIIALTANAIVGSEQMFLNKGFQAFLSKPIDLARLDEVIRQWVRDKDKEWVNYDAPPNSQNETKSQLHGISINGLNISKGIERYGGDINTYLGILRSYVKNTRPILERIKVINEYNVDEYIIDVHGIKGSSRGIYAGTVGDLADKLEKEAESDNLGFVVQNNEAFLETVWKLIYDIENMLSVIKNENSNPIKDRPDKNALLKMLAACENFEMDGLDLAMAEIDRYEYESGGELVSWLRDNISEGNFNEIKDRLLALI